LIRAVEEFCGFFNVFPYLCNYDSTALSDVLITAVNFTASRCVGAHIVVDREDRLASDGDTDRTIGRHLQEADSEEQGTGCREQEVERRGQNAESRKKRAESREQRGESRKGRLDRRVFQKGAQKQT
jgi:hypothetical protein